MPKIQSLSVAFASWEASFEDLEEFKLQRTKRSPGTGWSQGEKALCVVQRFAALFVPFLGDRKKDAFPNIADWRSSVTELVFPLKISKH